MNILVIEDEPDIRKNLEYNLSREGFTVTCSSSLSQAESILNSNTFSLILLDLMLPDGSGLDLCKKIKKLNFSIILCNRSFAYHNMGSSSENDFITLFIKSLKQWY